ncbi:MAG: TRAP transporter small permease subunit [Myxococcales bacterium]|nr:TRAP transporter small permease subunit [Myxococcales bacterium]
MLLLQRLSAGVSRAHTWLGHGVRWLVLVMVLVGSFNAVARYLGRYIGTNLSSNGFLEAQWYLFAAVFLLAAPYTLLADRHVRVDVLYGRASPRTKAAIDLAGTVLFLLPFCVFGAWGSAEWVANSWAVFEQSPNTGGLPRYPVKTLIPVAFVALGLQGLALIPGYVTTLREGA